MASASQAQRSYRLSYTQIKKVDHSGLEPLTFCLQSRPSTIDIMPQEKEANPLRTYLAVILFRIRRFLFKATMLYMTVV